MNINDLTFGIEIETSYAPSGIRRGGYHNGNAVTFNNAPAFNGNRWLAERDSSLNGAAPCEFVSPVLKGEEGVAHLVEFVKWLNDNGCKVNQSCGVHIHVGVGSISSDSTVALNTVGKMMEACKKYENGIYAQSGSDRRNGRWCRAMNDADKADVANAKKYSEARNKARALKGRDDRYRLLNLRNLFQGRNTVEFRAFAGTLNIHKLLAHLMTVLAITDFAHACAAGDRKIMWKDWAVSGSKSLGYIFKKAANVFAQVPTMKANKSKMRMWAMAMAYKFDRRNGATPEAAAVKAWEKVQRHRRQG